MIALLSLMAFISLSLVGAALANMMSAREARRRALGRRLAEMTGWIDQAFGAPLLKDRRLSRIALLDALLSRLPVARPLRRLLLQAGVKRRVGEVVLYIVLLALTGFLLVVLLGGSRPAGMVTASICGAVPLVLLRRMRSRRAATFAEQLPDGLDLMRAALQAGNGLLGALSLIAEEFPDPIAEEFREVAEEVRLGLPMRDALYNLADRTANPDVPLLAIGLLVAQEVGGNLAEVLDNISYTIRERFKLQREMRVLTAQGRLSGMVLTILPFALGAFMYGANRTYFAPMLTSTTGHYMIAYVVVSVLMGHFMIRRLVTIRF